MIISIHPDVDNGVQPGSDAFSGGTLNCKCSDKRVTVTVASQAAHKEKMGSV